MKGVRTPTGSSRGSEGEGQTVCTSVSYPCGWLGGSEPHKCLVLGTHKECPFEKVRCGAVTKAQRGGGICQGFERCWGRILSSFVFFCRRLGAENMERHLQSSEHKNDLWFNRKRMPEGFRVCCTTPSTCYYQDTCILTKPHLCVGKSFSSEMGLLNKYKTINNEAMFFQTPSGAFKSTGNTQHFKSRWVWKGS